MSNTNSSDNKGQKEKILTACLVLFGVGMFVFVLLSTKHDAGTTPGGDQGPSVIPYDSSVSREAPSIVRSKVDDLAVRRATKWLTNGGVVKGVDAGDRVIVELYLGSGQEYQGHYVFQYYFDPYNSQKLTGIQVQKFEPMGDQSPGIFHNRCVGSTNYRYADDGTLKEATLVGSMNNFESGVYLDTDLSNKIACMRVADSQGRSTPVNNPTKQQIVEQLTPYYFNDRYAVPKIGSTTL